MERQAVGRELEPLLIELINLTLTAKQAHWSVTGCASGHFTQLDELAC